MVHMVQMVTLYSTMFSLPFLGIICSVKPKAETSNSKADTLSFKRILFFTFFAQFWYYGSPPEEQQTFPEGPEGRCSFQKAASAILSHLHYL